MSTNESDGSAGKSGSESSRIEHTPGPWSYHSYMASGRQFGIETADRKHGIAGVHPNSTASTLLTMEQHEANARLIAAAPDLLGALTWLLDDLTDAGEDHNPETGDVYDSVQHARDVLAKAIG